MSRLGLLTVGRIPLSEPNVINYQVNASSGAQGVTLTGEEGGAPGEVWRARSQDIAALLGTDLPVTFQQKNSHDGLYRVTDAGAVITEWANEAYGFTWNLSLQRIGAANYVDIESNLSTTTRKNDFSLTPVRWHAPAIGSYGYDTLGSGTVSRAVEGDSNISVYLGLANSALPHWGTTASNMRRGRVSFFLNSFERTGTSIFSSVATGWILTNGIVRVTPQPSGSRLRIESWNGTTWDAQDVLVGFAGVTANDWAAVTVIRNDFEAVTIRLTVDFNPGRGLCDLTLRRGSRLVEGYSQCTSAGTMSMSTASAVTTTNNAATGHIVASANDTAGNRYVAGSPFTFTGSTTGAMTLGSAVQMAWWAGHVINGTSPASGDSATNLRDQYVGTPSSKDAAVKR